MGLGQIASSSAPIFGGALLAIAAGQFRGPDYRGLIKQDMDLLDRLPPEATKRRAELERTIEARIDDLVDAADRGRALRRCRRAGKIDKTRLARLTKRRRVARACKSR
jgi:hypothetical protein